ncbi:MAG: glycoside hydrolase family 92 protein [Ruminococcaceae bacterium]|nr:glycoside hydrolase family 92 protein [Oscillospiraceae bacterium]
MWKIIRVFVSIFVAIETLFTGVFSGVNLKSVDMPEVEASEYGQYVDPFIGTGGTPWTCAMLSPAATVPFGTVRLGPDTCFVGGAYIIKMNTSGYYYEQGHIKGFSHSRLSGTGAEDYSCFRVTPATGKNKPAVMTYSHSKETASPGYYAVYLPSVGCLAELTADIHTGVHRYTFYDSDDARLYIDVTSAAANKTSTNGQVEYDEATGVISGGCLLDGQFAGRYDGLPTYFAAVTDKPVLSYEINEDENDCGIDLNFGSLENDSVELKVGISFVSKENALLNLKAETDGLNFDSVRKNAADDWEERLSSIKIDTDDKDIKTIFYTALYHSMIMPSNFTDVNGEYLGFDKKVSVADGYTYRTDMSLWDTCRTTHPLYTLIAEDIQTDCLKSLVEMAETGGSLPRWPMGAGYTGSMQGDPANIVITESYLKGITDFDVETAYEYMKKSSDGNVRKDGRNYIELYNEYGYIPQDIAPGDESVSRTLEYAWEDGAIASLAEALGKTDDAEKYAKKSMYYKNVFNPETKYFQARNSDGSFVWNFSPYITSFYDAVMIKKFADCYCEGSARQWRWSATQDIDGMIELFGSKEYFVSELEDFMEDASLTRAAVDPGSGYWIGNQPDIHTPYLFSNAGRKDLTQKWVRWTLKNRFSTDINGLDGNDDGGTVSAWYVFSSLGFYPLAGTDKYWIGSPNIDSAEIALSNGKILKITANNQSEKNIYVNNITLNGEKLDGCYITHSQLMNGGELVFTMGKTPNN